MTWDHHINRAKRINSPVSVEKKQVGPIPPGFKEKGFTINGIWGVYERQQGLETIRIYELPTQYRVSVTNPVAQDNQFLQPTSGKPQQKLSTKKLAGAGLGILGLGMLGKALGGSQGTSAPDPQQAHRVFISHSWQYEDHFQEVKSLLDDAYGFKYFDHSVSSDDPIDAQLPNHLRKKIRDQMQATSVVLVLAGMYVAHSQWIQEEIEMATEMEKPIIGVIPPENERVPNLVEDQADELVRADGNQILDAIERQST